ncbi:MAG: hypothetical protein KA712_19025 [Myxococcales bacterium]|nr:hypothetical protein [Myxococcales bacterium]
MAEGRDIDARLPLYTYLRPLVEGRRVLELGGRTRLGAEELGRLGASLVVALVDDGVIAGASAGRVRCLPARTPLDALVSAGPFDLVILPQAGADLAPRGRLQLAELARVLAPEGHVVLSAPSGDVRGPEAGALSYYDLQERLSAAFPVVRMFGQTPFAALGIAEFDADVSDLRVDAGLVNPDDEEPTRYVAIAGQTAGPPLGYALVQLPVSASPPPVARPAVTDEGLRTRLEAAEAETRRLTSKLADAQAEADGALRVGRAQAEEIEDLRGRIRRAAQTRAELDEEVARLRKALAEADESVLNLTRRTADEMSALASRLSSTLVPTSPPRDPPERGASPDARELASLSERLKQREAQLAQRESALFDRDERIAQLESEKQDFEWQLAGARAGAQAPAVQTVVGPSERERELEILLVSRERALEEFRQAASAHIHDVDRLRAAVAEQAAHVAELEDVLAEADARANASASEAERLRVALAQAQEADRARRSRLAELEGTLLRMRHESKAQASRPDDVELTLARRQLTELETRLAMMESALREAERGRSAATDRWNDAVERLMGLEQQSEVERAVVRQAQENVEQVARVAEEDVNRLRQALERSEDQLRKARGQLLPLRGRVAMLEREKEARDVAERDLVRTLLDEVGAIETGLREELERIAELSREVETARADAQPSGGEPGERFAE